jgi:hypothetical protein
VERVQQALGVSERRACRVLAQPLDQRSDMHVIKPETRRYSQKTSSSWQASTDAMDTAGSQRCLETMDGG